MVFELFYKNIKICVTDIFAHQKNPKSSFCSTMYVLHVKIDLILKRFEMIKLLSVGILERKKNILPLGFASWLTAKILLKGLVLHSKFSWTTV